MLVSLLLQSTSVSSLVSGAILQSAGPVSPWIHGGDLSSVYNLISNKKYAGFTLYAHCNFFLDLSIQNGVRTQYVGTDKGEKEER